MKKHLPHVVVVGATSWGCVLAIQLDRAGTPVTVLCRSEEESQTLSSNREQHRLLPGVKFSKTIRFASNFENLGNIDLIILAVPSQRLRECLALVLPMAPQPLPPLVSAVKGLEVDSNLRMSQVIQDELVSADMHTKVAVLSGPNIAREVAVGQASATVIATHDDNISEISRSLLTSVGFRVYSNTDIIGVEFGGALKNVIAIGSGIGEELNVGANARAAFLTRGLSEMTRLGVALGARQETFSGLTGLGDLLATTSSSRSRNRHVGEQLARGLSVEEILSGMVHVAEGIETTRAAWTLAQKVDIELPIVNAMYQVLFEKLRPGNAIGELMARQAGEESSGHHEV